MGICHSRHGGFVTELVALFYDELETLWAGDSNESLLFIPTVAIALRFGLCAEEKFGVI